MKLLLFRACVCACALVACEASARTLVEVAENRTLTAEEEIAADTVFDVKEGVTLDMASRALTIAGVTGKGAVANAALTLTLAEGPYRFDGTMAGTLTFSKTDDVPLDAFHLIVGGSDTLAAVTYTSPDVAATPILFASGVGRFNIYKIIPSSSERFTTEDVNGDPVTILTIIPQGHNTSWRVIGSGDFYLNAYIGSGGVNCLIFSELSGRMGPNDKDIGGTSNASKMTELEGVVLGGCGGNSAYFTYNIANSTFPWNLYFNGTWTSQIYCYMTFDGSKGEITIPASQIRVKNGYHVVRYKGAVRFKDGLFFNWMDGRTLMCSASGSDLIFDHASAGSDQWPYVMRHDGAAGTTSIRSVVVTNGAWTGINSALPTNIVITTKSRFYSGGGGTSQNPGVFSVDGGNLDVIASSSNGITPVPSNFEVHVGPNGAGFDGFQFYSLEPSMPAHTVAGLVKTASGCAKDGGVTTSGAGYWLFTQPMDIVGPFHLKSGFVKIPSGYTGDATSKPFGSGDFIFGTGWLEDASALTTVPIASGTGAKVKIDGMAELQVTLGDTWTFGPSGATSSSLVRTAGLGGVLCISAPGANGAVVPCIVNGGVEMAASGLPKVPVLLRTSHAASVGVGSPYFAEYVPGEGFQGFTNIVEYIQNSTPTSVVRPYSFTLTEDRTVAAMIMNGQTATLDEGATLTVGDGTNPAVILLTAGNTTDAQITGEGTLNFGTSEGVFVSLCDRGRSDHATVSATIAGSAGVSYNGLWAGTDNGSWVAVNISGDNTYSGGTRLCGIAAYAKSPKAFSDGTVTLDGGQYHGSRLILATEGLVISNKVVASGAGGPHLNGSSNPRPGAICFAVNAELAGDLECADRTWIGTYENTKAIDHEGILSGVVSGESAVILPGSGAIVMTNTNTVRHTEIFGKLILRGNKAQACAEELIFGNTGTGSGSSSGTGIGTLRIENTEPVTITSRIVGQGTIELAGSAPVTFSDAYTFRGKIDICGGDRTVTGLGDFVTEVTNSTANTTGVLTMGGKMRLGNTIIRPGVGLAAATGAGLNLQGTSVSLPAVGGSGRIFGAPLTVTGEIHPGGEGAVGTLALCGGLTLGADAKLVTEVDASGIDKLSVDGDFSLDGLPLEVRRLTRSPERTGTIFETSETLSGAWESVTLPARGKYELSEILDSSRVDLTVRKAGVALYLR